MQSYHLFKAVGQHYGCWVPIGQKLDGHSVERLILWSSLKIRTKLNLLCTGRNQTGHEVNMGWIRQTPHQQNWHVYAMEWTSTNIKSYLDGNEFFSMNISGVDPYYPFNEEFFFIFNVAMGGTNGGVIDPDLQQGYIDAMEVDYIRVFQ